MGGISFFKVPKHRVFNYQPLYYDQEKERREQRRKELGLDDESESAGYTTGSLIRSGGMRARHEQFNQKMESQKRKSQVILIALIIGLSILTYYMMRDYLDEIVEVVF
ncbi:MAG: hypothetical protein MJZ15_01115 [Bacteroidales bacterium]|nr:hypothetical protein [Bacteroidales bacterium]